MKRGRRQRRRFRDLKSSEIMIEYPQRPEQYKKMAQKHLFSKEQDLAANPSENVWVQANAGTGKTSVLVQRLLRILFRTDARDVGILCLTYTNAAANEMRNRILKALRNWATANDEELRGLLKDIAAGQNATEPDLRRARGIFYKYIDNQSILKIKTIHGFCEEILRRFPMEAGISPAWKLVSDSNQKILLADAFHRLINSPASLSKEENNQVSAAFLHMLGQVSEYYLDDLLSMLTTQYKQFFHIDNISSFRKYFIDTIRYFLDLDSPEPTGSTPEILQNIVKNAENDINSSKKPAAYLINIVNLTKQYIDKTIDFDEYKYAYLTSQDTKNLNVGRKNYLTGEQECVYRINQRRLDEKIFSDTMALFDLSAAFAKTYKDLKAERNMLDFDDLILYTRKLFSKPDSMGWVLSQLDMSLNHILVDEAQDTSPEQWDILKMLSGDFFADGDLENHARSLFVVGDSKQSIYAFQGADLQAFSVSKNEIAAQIRNNFRTIEEVPLMQSFRSTAPILRVLDYFFGDARVREATGFANSDHKCFRGDAPGLVEIHKLASKETDEI
ncbi:MAG: UvrD-helicase domain-containing protein [Rickettsiales bacterium]|jgi:ATP-dependent helicase/nuclease subunit A|nr:UvrD-helicase domain-containing protein [Rickettsiales bacterium]